MRTGSQPGLMLYGKEKWSRPWYVAISSSWLISILYTLSQTKLHAHSCCVCSGSVLILSSGSGPVLCLCNYSVWLCFAYHVKENKIWYVEDWQKRKRAKITTITYQLFPAPWSTAQKLSFSSIAFFVGIMWLIIFWSYLNLYSLVFRRAARWCSG